MKSHDHERSDAKAKPLLWFALGLTGVAVGTFILMGIMFKALEAGSPYTGETEREEKNEPLLQTRSKQDLHEILDAQREQIESYEWVNREAGVVRIPIDRAMDILSKNPPPSRRED
jgi:hypothetical protein